MKKIVTLGITLNDEQKNRLMKIATLDTQESPNSPEDFLDKTQDADVIYSNGEYLLESLDKLENVFVVYPYIELWVLNTDELEKKWVIVANAQGGNRDSIVERTMFMLLSLYRKFIPAVRTAQNLPFALQESLYGKKLLIVGHGSIGNQIGIVSKAFGMEVSYFERWDNLSIKSKDIDVVINALNCNTSSKNLLDRSFFMNLPEGSYYITFARPYTYDLDGLIEAIDAGIVAGAEIDCDPEESGDTDNAFYQKALSNPKILVTPHIAFATKQASTQWREITLQNIESYLMGKIQNRVKKI